jgi:3'-phosphoadenosine 5'-phosphosulfate sulfotransferase (PAPS reductase)/FAD synthetase
MLLKQSFEIYNQAIKEYQPYATVLMFSGGDDSLTAYHVARALEIPIDFIIHVNTRTGIPETTEFVRRFVADSGILYLEGDAGTAYEDYVMRKGFFGLGQKSHSCAYHILKADVWRNQISHHIRNGKRGRNVLMLNGARWQESKNREQNIKDKPIRREKKGRPNIWVNLIHDWSKLDCVNFLADCKTRRNPVTELLHRSGECLCGTMQNQETRREAAFWFPHWGKWLDDLENRVIECGFCWRWGESQPDWITARQNGQMDFGSDWLPMCQNCSRR